MKNISVVLIAVFLVFPSFSKASTCHLNDELIKINNRLTVAYKEYIHTENQYLKFCEKNRKDKLSMNSIKSPGRNRDNYLNKIYKEK